MTDTDDAALIAAMTDELAARDAPLEFVMRPLSAFHLAGVLQLALRHPDLPESSRRIAVTFLEHVRAYFADLPACTEVLRRGDDPRQDRVH
jgi:hypothetical protein